MTSTPTAGETALQDAMRLETARIYSQLCPETPRRQQLPVDIGYCIRAGWTNSRIMTVFDVSYDVVRTARKAAMRRIRAVSEQELEIVSRDNEGTENKSAPALFPQRNPGPNPQTGGLMAETMPPATDDLAQARPAVSP